MLTLHFSTPVRNPTFSTAVSYPRSSFNYEWNIPVPVNDISGVNLQWDVPSDGKTLSIVGEAGKNFWIDPESQIFMRVNYGKYGDFSKAMNNLIDGFKKG